MFGRNRIGQRMAVGLLSAHRANLFDHHGHQERQLRRSLEGRFLAKCFGWQNYLVGPDISSADSAGNWIWRIYLISCPKLAQFIRLEPLTSTTKPEAMIDEASGNS